ncbi:MAG: hypothetical protein R3E73_14810 [Porticoccaceae bacterium]
MICLSNCKEKADGKAFAKPRSISGLINRNVNIHFGDLVGGFSLELRNVVKWFVVRWRLTSVLTEMPEQGQFSVGGYLSRMDLSEWRTVYGLWQNNGASLSVGTALMPKLDLRFDQAEIGEFRLRDVLLKGARQGSQWQLNLDSDLAAGDVIILPDADRSLTIALSRLSLPKADDSADPLKNINPADHCGQNFSAGHFRCGGESFMAAHVCSFCLSRKARCLTILRLNSAGFFLVITLAKTASEYFGVKKGNIRPNLMAYFMPGIW